MISLVDALDSWHFHITVFLMTVRVFELTILMHICYFYYFIRLQLFKYEIWLHLFIVSNLLTLLLELWDSLYF
jgi:hypothetical protein